MLLEKLDLFKGLTPSHTSCDWYPMKHDADVSELDLKKI